MKVENIIPQVFYDLIARFIPGLIILFCAELVQYGPDQIIQSITSLIGSKDQGVEISFYLFLIVGVLSYSIALVAMGFWTLLSRISRRSNLVFLKDNDKRWLSIKETLKTDIKIAGCNLGFVSDNKQEDIPSMAFIYDFVRLRSPEVGSRLVKIRAECHMCAVLITGLIAIGIWNLFKIIASPIEIEIIVELGIIFVILACWFFMRDLEDRLMTGLCNYWVLLSNRGINGE